MKNLQVECDIPVLFYDDKSEIDVPFLAVISLFGMILHRFWFYLLLILFLNDPFVKNYNLLSAHHEIYKFYSLTYDLCSGPVDDGLVDSKLFPVQSCLELYCFLDQSIPESTGGNNLGSIYFLVESFH